MLLLMSKCWLNFAFYDPSILINIYAQPQKIFDSISIGVPLLVNTEMLFAKELESKKACLTSPYDDIETIVNKINYFLIHNSNLLKEVSQNSLDYYKSSNLFEVSKCIEKIYE